MWLTLKGLGLGLLNIQTHLLPVGSLSLNMMVDNAIEGCLEAMFYPGFAYWEVHRGCA